MFRPAASLGALCAALALACPGLWGCTRTVDAYPEEFAGVGIVLQATSAGFVVSQVVAAGPAAEAGVRTGSVLRSVDGRPVEGRSLASVVSILRGRPETTVALTLESDGGARETFALTRRALARHEDAGYGTP
jgi:C-terminal processing protease CtpA/Prc